jgi:hypothetical protein
VRLYRIKSDELGIRQADDVPRLFARVDMGSQPVDSPFFLPAHALRPRFRFSGVRLSFFGDFVIPVVPTFPFACRRELGSVPPVYRDVLFSPSWAKGDSLRNTSEQLFVTMGHDSEGIPARLDPPPLAGTTISNIFSDFSETVRI